MSELCLQNEQKLWTNLHTGTVKTPHLEKMALKPSVFIPFYIYLIKKYETKTYYHCNLRDHFIIFCFFFLISNFFLKELELIHLKKIYFYFVFFSFLSFFFFFPLHLQHGEVSGPGIQPSPQQWPRPLQQCQILNPLSHHKGNPTLCFLILWFTPWWVWHWNLPSESILSVYWEKESMHINNTVLLLLGEVGRAPEKGEVIHSWRKAFSHPWGKHPHWETSCGKGSSDPGRGPARGK